MYLKMEEQNIKETTKDFSEWNFFYDDFNGYF